MNKQKLIEKYEEKYETIFGYPVIQLNQILEDLKQLDEPQKVVVPQFVAGWMNYCKLTGVDLYHAFEMSDLYLGNYAYQKDYPKLKGYFESENNQEIFARAWLDGYEVEQEKRYSVKVKGVSGYGRYLNKVLSTGEYFFASDSELGIYKTKHTKEELENSGFGWVFDCEGIEIKEVE